MYKQFPKEESKMDLNILARTLAERLTDELTEYGTNSFDEGEIGIMEAVIREAIDKTLQRSSEIGIEQARKELNG
jgi:hypothetical protein